MTEKELRRLGRQDLLQLLLAQSRETARLKESVEDLKGALAEERELTERLKGKLDEKDAALERLKERLNDKDASIERLKGRLDDKDEKMRKLIETRGGTVPAEWLLDRWETGPAPRRTDAGTAEPPSRQPAKREEEPRFSGPEPAGQTDAGLSDELFSESVEERLRRLKDRIAGEDTAANRLEKDRT